MNKINLTICGLILFFILLIGLYFHQKGSTLVKVNEGYVSNQNSEQERVMRLLEERYGIGGDSSNPVSGGGGSRPVSGGSWAPPSLHIHHNHHVTGGDVPGGHVTGGGGASHGTNPLQPPSHPSHSSSSNPDNPVGNPTHHATGGNKPPPHSSTLPGYYLTFQYNNMTYYLQEPTTVNNIKMSYTSNINDATTFNVHNAGTKNRYFTIVNPKNNAGGPNKPFSLVIFFGTVQLTDISNLKSQITSGHVNNDTSTGPINYQLSGLKAWVNITPTLTTAPHGSTVNPTHHTTGGYKPPLHSNTLPGYYLTFQYNNMTYYLQEPTTINNANMYYTSNINDATTFNVHNAGTKNRYFTIVNPKNQAGGPNKPFSLVIFFGHVLLTDISNLQSQITSGRVNDDTSTGPIKYQIQGFQPQGTWLFITPTLTTAPHGSTISPAPPAHSPSGSTVSPAPVTHSPSGSSPHTYTHCHTHSDPNHTHSPSDTINVVASKYTKSIRT